MRIDSSGNVGIGETAPVMQLHVSGGIAVSSDDSLTQVSRLYESFGLQIDSGDAANNTRPIVFRTGGTERMRLDSSGNLLVGKTVATYTTDGVALQPNGSSNFSRSTGAASNAVVAVNRNTSDGTLVTYSKDGSSVGSIGTRGGDLLIGTGDVALRFSDASDAITAQDISLNQGRDAAVRFKDLYLSGGVYLGGTGAANKLDDYEEGTWTPTFENGTFTYSNQSGWYTKIGNLVTIGFMITWSSKSGSGAVKVALPFANTSTGNLRFAGSCGYMSGVDMGTYSDFTWRMSSGGVTGVTLGLNKDQSTGAASDVSNMSSAGEVQGSISYIV
jgi:hypothetical protein